MTDDRQLIDAVERACAGAEGLRLSAYQDGEGVWTIGYGTNLQELQIDADTAQRWLTQKVAQSAREARCFPWFTTASEGRQRAVVELIYNLGLPRYQTFTKHLHAMSVGDYETAADELLKSRWRTQVKDARALRIAALVRRGEA